MAFMYNNEILRQGKDLTGQQFGKWTVISFAGRLGNHYAWNCRCSCGTKKVMHGYKLLGKFSSSCQKCCNMTHGKTNSPEYRTWKKMKERCNNYRCKEYRHYGARGIVVCDRWQNSFENFLADMGPKPETGRSYSIDRYPNQNGNYEPENCRWANQTQQCRNKRTNRMLTFNGKTQCLAAWSKETGIPFRRIASRIDRDGWSIEKALTAPICWRGRFAKSK